MTQIDHAHVLRKRALHRLLARALRRDTEVVVRLARQALEDQIAHMGEEIFHTAWRKILSMPVDEIARLLIERSYRMDNLRDSSPFMRLFGYDLGKSQRIDLQDEVIRKRLWRMGMRLVRRSPPLPNYVARGGIETFIPGLAKEFANHAG
jgi:hypothetical protein